MIFMNLSHLPCMHTYSPLQSCLSHSWIFVSCMESNLLIPCLTQTLKSVQLFALDQINLQIPSGHSDSRHLHLLFSLSLDRSVLLLQSSYLFKIILFTTSPTIPHPKISSSPSLPYKILLATPRKLAPKTTSFNKLFFPSSIPLWNALPPALRVLGPIA